MKRTGFAILALLGGMAWAQAQDAFVPTAGPRDAPTSPTLVSPAGDVLVTGSVGLPTNRPLPPAGECVAVHASCPITGGSAPGLVCQCFVPGIGAESGITR